MEKKTNESGCYYIYFTDSCCLSRGGCGVNNWNLKNGVSCSCSNTDKSFIDCKIKKTKICEYHQGPTIKHYRFAIYGTMVCNKGLS
jgi:hypothetical protein